MQFPIQIVAYISQSNLVKAEQLGAMQERAKTYQCRNAQLGITGALFLRGTIFFQYLEGPNDLVQTALKNIKQDPSHEDFYVLINEPTAERGFPDWPMECFYDPAHSECLVDALQQVGHRFSEAGGFNPSGLMNYVRRLVTEMAEHRIPQACETREIGSHEFHMPESANAFEATALRQSAG